MNKPSTNLLTLAFLLALGLCPAWGQGTDRYVTAAKLQMSVGDSTTVWLNGFQLVTEDPHISSKQGYAEHIFTTDQLCWFSGNNVLAFEITETLEHIDPTTAEFLHLMGDTVGVAYVLTITYSDNTTTIVTSSETGKTLNYHSTSQPDVPGWATREFSDTSWAPAKLAPPSQLMAVKLDDPITHQPALTLAAWKNDNQIIQHNNEKWLFRRPVPLTVGIRPGCQAIRVKKLPPTPTPKPMPPTATPTKAPPTATFTPVPPKPTNTPRPTNTPIPPKATSTPVPPKATNTPIPTPTPRPTLEIKKPTPLPIPTKKPVEVPPTATLPPVKEHKIEEPPTLTPTDTPQPTQKRQPTPTREIPPTATFTAMPTNTPESVEVEIVVPNPPVNIDATFADGPGQYKVEIVDESGNHLATLFDKQLTYRKETWISWDGKNEQGALMGPGRYYALFTRDGNLMRKIALHWFAPNP